MLLGDLRNHFIQRFDVGVDVIDTTAQLFSNQRVGRYGEACLCRDLIFDQSAPCCQQLSEIMDIFAFCSLRGQVKNDTHAGQHFGINAVGLGQSADRLRKTPRLLRIDLDEGAPRQTEISLKSTMIGTGRFENDQYPVIFTKPGT